MRTFLSSLLLFCLVGGIRAVVQTVEIGASSFLNGVTAGPWIIWGVSPSGSDNRCIIYYRSTLDGSSSSRYSLGYPCSSIDFHYNDCDQILTTWVITKSTHSGDSRCFGTVQLLVFAKVERKKITFEDPTFASCYESSTQQKNWGISIVNTTLFFHTYTPPSDYDYCTFFVSKLTKQSEFCKTGELCGTTICWDIDDTNPKVANQPSLVNSAPRTSLCGTNLDHFIGVMPDSTLRTYWKRTRSNVEITYNGGPTSTMRLIGDSQPYTLISTVSGVGFGTLSSYTFERASTKRFYKFSTYSDPKFQNYFFTEDFAPIIGGEYDPNTNVRFWATQSRRLVRDNNGKMKNFGVLTDLFANSSTELIGMYFDGTTKSVAVTTTSPDKQIIRYNVVPVFDCANYTNCVDCIGNDPEYCGWNVNTAKCTLKSESTIATLSKCPVITSIFPSIGAVAVPKKITVYGSNMYLDVVSASSTFCVITNSTGAFYVTGTRWGSNNVNCTLPSQAGNSSTVTISLTRGGPKYADINGTDANVYQYKRCTDFDTARKCQLNLDQFGDCGWCNSTSICTSSTQCASKNFTRTLFPSVSSISPSALASDTPTNFTIRGSNFAKSSQVVYTLHLFQANKREEITEDEPSEGISFLGQIFNSSTIRFPVFVSQDSQFIPAIYSNGMLIESTATPRPIISTNCSSRTNCQDCRAFSVCNWCRDECVSRTSTLRPCVESDCKESLPSLSLNSGDVKGDFGLNISFWYPLNTTSSNYSLYFETFESEFLPLSFFGNQSAQVSVPNGTFTVGVFQPFILSDFYSRNTSEKFTFVSCSQQENCTMCERAPGCIWTDSNTGELECTSLQLYPTSKRVACPIPTSVNPQLSSTDDNPTLGTNGINSNDLNKSNNHIPIIIGCAVGGGVLLLLILILIILIVSRKGRRFASRDSLMAPPQDFEMVVVSKDAEPTFNLSKHQSNMLEGLQAVLLKEGFPYSQQLLGITTGADMEGFGRYYMYVALSRDCYTARDLLQTFLRMDVDSTKGETTIFRTTSSATQMYTAYAKVLGLEFLWNTLASSVHQIIRAGEEEKSSAKTKPVLGSMVLEIDADVYGEEDPEFLEANMYQLLSILSKIFVKIKKNISTLSPWIRLTVRDTRMYVGKKYPALETKTVGSFIFLRYIVPAITSPHVYGLSKDPPNKHAQRMLVLVSRVMQNLANETLPSMKAESMAKLDQFVVDNIKVLHSMYDSITNYHPSEQELQEHSKIALPELCHENSIVWMHNFLSRNKPKIQSADFNREIGDFVSNEIPKK